jgi:ABC-type sugar transport system substrate-binding protein
MWLRWFGAIEVLAVPAFGSENDGAEQIALIERAVRQRYRDIGVSGPKHRSASLDN